LATITKLLLNLLSQQEVIKLETQYWTLVEIPKQEKQETVPAFVMRACSIMEKTQKSENKTPQKLQEEAAEKKERLERLDPMTTQQIEHENTQMINDLYRLLKKYQGLRNLIRELKVSFPCFYFIVAVMISYHSILSSGREGSVCQKLIVGA
jgi:mevalonate kinase